MRLRRLVLARYGKFTDRTIDFGEAVDGLPDLHVVYGPNEAGKSTLFSGFLDLLFGIELQSRYGFLHPYETMRVGGCLDLSSGPQELMRIKKPQPTLRDASNQPVAQTLLAGELGGLDRAAYRTMFSLDDETLESGGDSILASNGELGQLLFSASAGLAELSKTLLDIRSVADEFTPAECTQRRTGQAEGNPGDAEAGAGCHRHPGRRLFPIVPDKGRRPEGLYCGNYRTVGETRRDGADPALAGRAAPNGRLARAATEAWSLLRTCPQCPPAGRPS